MIRIQETRPKCNNISIQKRSNQCRVPVVPTAAALFAATLVFVSRDPPVIILHVHISRAWG